MKKIIVGDDGSEFADKALEKAIEFAKKEDMEIVVVYAIEDFCPIGVAELDCNIVREIQMKGAKNIVDRALQRIKDAGVSGRDVTKVGRPADVIIESAKKENAEMIVVASHGKHGIKKIALGSVTARVVEYSPIPVLVMK
ncbi:MAG: universal stress protein [Desulfobacterales bacterium]|nr:universal stress protein [Desulfobacterales bacterium]